MEKKQKITFYLMLKIVSRVGRDDGEWTCCVWNCRRARNICTQQQNGVRIISSFSVFLCFIREWRREKPCWREGWCVVCKKKTFPRFILDSPSSLLAGWFTHHIHYFDKLKRNFTRNERIYIRTDFPLFTRSCKRFYSQMMMKFLLTLHT